MISMMHRCRRLHNWGSEEVLAFARDIAHHPETWLDFPFPEEDEFDDFDISDAQYKHVLAVGHLAPRLAALRIELCPVHMSEGYFWMVYFVLLHSRLSKHDASMLSSFQIKEIWDQRPAATKNFKSFNFRDHRADTKNFPDSVLGEGGFGSVYKGWVDESTLAASRSTLVASRPRSGMVVAVKRLKQDGWHKEWLFLFVGEDSEHGKMYFFTRNHSSIVAFAIGKKYTAGNGVYIIGAHTDSPCLKLKPITKVTKDGYLEVGVQPYGGGLWHTWFDRDLAVAGRVIVREKKDELESFSHRLVRIEEPIMRVPTLAIHLDREVNDGFKVNKQTHLAPVLATSVKAELNKQAAGDCSIESGSTAGEES
ncbi:Zn-dependent exopeptidases superfamily protein [Striga hermonthica]|uniref:Zn-dependent exopeptidases superfamily protein n=1 Tax=Striga hermonthica TaxID=68872 RepID=A0A9N7NPJ9_STRHE|nr:Zn-dependent exopeptidases superfamily protein [Striga hermonthica]